MYKWQAQAVLKELGEEDEDLRCDIINDAKAVRATAAAARAAAVFVVPAGPPSLASGSGAASSSSCAAAAPPAGAAIALPPLAVTFSFPVSTLPTYDFA